MNRHIRALAPWAAAALAVLLAAIWWTAGREEKVSYLTEAARRGDVARKVIAVGEVSAAQLVSVGAQVSGQIVRLHVELGQEVKKGDLVAEIDSTTQENELRTNEARLNTYQAQLEARRIALKIAETRYQRELVLSKKDATSKENLETAENTLALARAEVDELESLVLQTEIAVSTSRVNLGYTKIAAPLDGTVVSVPVEEGQTVNANQTTPTIVQIADLSRMEIRMEISEGDVTRVMPGMDVSYTILSEPDRIYTTTLRSIDPGLTTLTDGSYTGATSTDSAVYYYGKLLVPNPEGKLRIGMTAQSEITIASAENVLLVPSMAVRGQGDRRFVVVLDAGGTPSERQVAVGISDSLNTEIVSGLEAGELVVTSQMTSSEIQADVAGARGPRPRM